MADSGATNHITNDSGNLQFKIKYHGTGSLTVGDGTKLAIAHVGNINVSLDQMPLKLKNILHVPHIQRNLLSVAKLTTDNDVFVEFHSNCCFVKEKEIRKVVLQGILKNGLYQLSLPHQSPSKDKVQISFTSPSPLQKLVRVN